MKTRYKIIIIGIVLASIVFGHTYLMALCKTLPEMMHIPRPLDFWPCLGIDLIIH